MTEYIVSFMLMAFALSLDSFSISLSLGAYVRRLQEQVYISVVFGLFHSLLPLVGMFLGVYLSSLVTSLASLLSACIFIIIGAYMFFSSFEHKMHYYQIKGLKLYSLALLVSVDSFPVGVSLGLTAISSLVPLLIFGFFAMIFTFIGLYIARRAHRVIGIYSERIGGIILFIIGLSYIF